MPVRRLPAEWEPQSMVQFTFPHAESDWADDLAEVTSCFVRCIETVSRFQKVLVVADDRERVAKLLADLP
ncbi:MAG: agmatine deiminase family protein, partial [Bacteroidota bacterium]